MANRIYTFLITTLVPACSGDLQMKTGADPQPEEDTFATMAGVSSASSIEPIATSTTTSESDETSGSESTTPSIPASTSLGDSDISISEDINSSDCDPWAQDCPSTEKCTWYSSDGSYIWDETKCVPLARDPVQIGVECSAVGDGITGVDNCDLGAMCWDVNAEGIGYCVPLCEGVPSDGTCAEKFYCQVYAHGLSLCFETCHPLLQDCVAPTSVCLPNDSSVFTCMPDTSGNEGQIHGTCGQTTCDPGNICLFPESAIECNVNSQGCCEPFCDTTLLNDCPGQGQECIPYYKIDPIPPGYENVGYCALTG